MRHISAERISDDRAQNGAPARVSGRILLRVAGVPRPRLACLLRPRAHAPSLVPVFSSLPVMEMNAPLHSKVDPGGAGQPDTRSAGSTAEAVMHKGQQAVWWRTRQKGRVGGVSTKARIW
jgi:hypothetical protein